MPVPYSRRSCTERFVAHPARKDKTQRHKGVALERQRKVVNVSTKKMNEKYHIAALLRHFQPLLEGVNAEMSFRRVGGSKRKHPILCRQGKNRLIGRETNKYLRRRSPISSARAVSHQLQNRGPTKKVLCHLPIASPWGISCIPARTVCIGLERTKFLGRSPISSARILSSHQLELRDLLVDEVLQLRFRRHAELLAAKAAEPLEHVLVRGVLPEEFIDRNLLAEGPGGQSPPSVVRVANPCTTV